MPTALALLALLCAGTPDPPGDAAVRAASAPRLVPSLDAGAMLGAPAPELRLVRADLHLGPGAPPLDGGGRAGDGARVRDLRSRRRTLGWSTAAALAGAEVLGTLAAIDQPTAFGDGRCLTGHPVLGSYGCDRGLSVLHGATGVLSATLYTAHGVLGLAAPESRGTVSPGARPWHRALSWIHLGGIVVQPVIGLVSAYPQVIGQPRGAPTDPFPKGLRTAHVVVGYVTAAAFWTTLALER